MSSNLSPFFAVLCDELFYVKSFLVSYRGVVKRWLKVLVVTFSALFRSSCGQQMRNANPVCGTMIVNKRQ